MRSSTLRQQVPISCTSAWVNYTTLGYGDVIPMARWRLLGPMTAMNGVLLFGWSTAVIFQVLRRTMLSDVRGT
jgi:hypothetical protein